jgi:hypothetical protein
MTAREHGISVMVLRSASSGSWPPARAGSRRAAARLRRIGLVAAVVVIMQASALVW